MSSFRLRAVPRPPGYARLNLEKVFDVSQPFSSVAGYASLLGVTPSHLNRTVKAETGKSAGEWIDNARLALARELLCDRSMPMSEIAERLCFSEASYFSRFSAR